MANDKEKNENYKNGHDKHKDNDHKKHDHDGNDHKKHDHDNNGHKKHDNDGNEHQHHDHSNGRWGNSKYSNLYVVNENNKLDDINDAGGSHDTLASFSKFSDLADISAVDSDGDGFVDQLSLDMVGRTVTIQNFFDNSSTTAQDSGFGNGLIEHFIFKDGKFSAKDMVSKIEVTDTETLPDGAQGRTHAAQNLTGGTEKDTIFGLEGDDILMGYADTDTIDGGSGDDYIDGGQGNDSMIGAEGNDVYIVDSVDDVITELDGEGNDTILTRISLDMADNVEKIRLQGVDDINATGNELDNQMFGNNGDNNLNGGLGNDVLDGGLGSDILVGAQGDDFYYVDNANDAVIELLTEGTDTVYATVEHTLSDNVENLRLFGTDELDGSGNELDNNLTGNSANNTLIGLDGHDVIDGGGGVDTLIGGNNDDWYIIRNTNDVIVEAEGDAAGTTDYAFSYVDYTIGDNVENLRLYGNANLNGIGNSGDNVLYGNYGNNTLSGLEGNDFIDGGAGADTMIGGVGDDNFVVDNVNDIVVENSGEGFDTILARANVTMADNIEKLRMQGDDNLSAIGNDANNIMIGNNANNAILGAGGDDSLVGLGGNDTFMFELGSGHDAIGDFENGSDLLDISGWNITDFNDLIITETFGDTSITFDGANGEMVTLQNVEGIDIDATDFVLA